ncbi:MAG: Tfp pilus assembly protein FimT/FimU [Bdellovibrionales bacterium]
MKKILKSKILLTAVGFTLMEVMIVMVLIAGVVTLAIPRLSNDSQQVRADIRRLSVTTRRMLQEAQMKNKTYRLVLEMNNSEEEPDSYWLESSSKAHLFDPRDDQEEREAKLEAKKRADDGETTETEEAARGFQIDSKVLKKPKKLPEGYRFKSISYSNRETISEGQAYIYFYPQGFTEESLIHIQNEKDNINWSLLVHPLTGYVDILTQEVKLEDLKQGR